MSKVMYLEVLRCKSNGHQRCFCGAGIPKGVEYRWHQYKFMGKINTFKIFDHEHLKGEKNV